MRDIVNNYIQKFNSDEQTEHSNEIKNADCFDWFSANVPTFSCSDKTVEETYYFRYWTYRKHIKKTEDGHVVTEFFPAVPWAGNDNAIVCPVVHHIREGRWLKDGGFLLDYIRHYLTGRGSGENVLHYQSGFVAAAGEYLLTQCDAKVLSELAPALEKLYLRMKEKYKTAYPDLYWSDDNRDGMEYSLSGNGIRPTINSYMAAGAGTLGRVFKKLGEAEKADAYFAEYGRIANNVDRILWDEKDGFYKNRHTEARDGTPDFGLTDPDRNVMEEIGYIPFMYGIGGKDRRSAFRYLTDPKHFDAPFGPTTADRSHPRFRTVNVHHECLWDGPSWPFATSQTLTAL
ncbi:MAG: hypothetical protein MJ082_06255, partial [Clostridia bacterium]|nr:hypothetical protein [Clostridia bacterium]